MDYSTLWQKANEQFYAWEDEQIQTGLYTDLSDRDRILFVTGFILGTVKDKETA